MKRRWVKLLFTGFGLFFGCSKSQVDSNMPSSNEVPCVKELYFKGFATGEAGNVGYYKYLSVDSALVDSVFFTSVNYIGSHHANEMLYSSLPDILYKNLRSDSTLEVIRHENYVLYGTANGDLLKCNGSTDKGKNILLKIAMDSGVRFDLPLKL